MPALRSHLNRTEHRISYAMPYDYEFVISFLSVRALPGVENVIDGVYRRTFSTEGRAGVFEVSHVEAERALRVVVWTAEESVIPVVLSKVSEIFGVDMESARAVAHLIRDPELGSLVSRRPGLRIPGTWDGFETAVRAVTGQQVTLTAATAMVGRAAKGCGSVLPWPEFEAFGLTRLFPEPKQLAQADLYDIGMPPARTAALRSLAEVASLDPELFSATKLRRLVARPGIGDWTVQYIAMRSLRDQDAFPASDVVIRRALTIPGEARPTAAAVTKMSQAWRPFRAWATIHLWAAAAEAKSEPVLALAAAGA
jgi:AraC family transcriptional regulator of adaptative response / DNA-3-methyladenine glycosylase II